jgi:hypothetical protein
MKKTPTRVPGLAAVVLLVATAVPAREPALQGGTPSVDYVLPWRVVAGSSRVRITVYGRHLEDCSVVKVRRATETRDVPANLVGETLVFTLPDALAATPGEISVRVAGNAPAPGEIRIDVVKPAGETVDPFLSKVDPEEVIVPRTGKVRLLLHGENLDPQALVFLRPEGRGGTGIRLETGTASEEAQLEALVSASAAPESGTYELRVVNPTARQSNWVRVVLKVLSAEC